MQLTEIPCPLAKWPGKIQVISYIPFPILIQFEKAAREMKKGEGVSLQAMYDHMIPVLCSIVQKWEIVGLPENVSQETFPGNADLLNWVIEEITKMMGESSTPDPNLPAQA